MLFYTLYVVFVFWHPMSTRNSATKEIFPVATISDVESPSDCISQVVIGDIL